MAAGTTPIFGQVLKSSWSALSTSAVTGTDGTDANIKTIFTAGANGSKIDEIHIQPLGTNSGDTVIRFWINNGSTAGTATNNSLVHEETLGAYTLSQGAATTLNTSRVWKANLTLPAGYKILAASGTAIAGGMQVTAIGADY